MSKTNNAAQLRSQHSMRNARYGMLFYVILLLLSFFFRRYFIEVLGAELLGVNSTVQNILYFLNVAELGLASAISFALYQPLANNNRTAINEIVSLQALFYRRIALFISVVSLILLPFFPYFFDKSGVPIIYACATFAVMLISTLLSYLINYRMVILSSDQREYKVSLAVQGPRVVKQTLQIIALLYFDYPYVWWLGLELFFAIVSTLLIELFIRRGYPWLEASIKLGKASVKKHRDIIVRIKQLMYHKIAGFMLNQSGPLIIVSFTSFTVVTIYNNYLLVMNGLMMLLEAAFNGLKASIGNLIVESNEKEAGKQSRVEALFRQLFSFRLWLVACFVWGLYQCMGDFVTLWIAKEFTLSYTELILWLCFVMLALNRVPDLFINAYGIYQDVGAPVVEALINLSLALSLGYFWGLSGVLLGINISLLLVVHGWKPYFLYRTGFKMRVWGYFYRLAGYLAILALSALGSFWLIDLYPTYGKAHSWTALMGKAVLSIIPFALLSAVLFYIFAEPYRLIIKRIIARFRGQGSRI